MQAELNFHMLGTPAPAPPPLYRERRPAEFRVFALREAPHYDTYPDCATPDQAAAYWRRAIAPSINPDVETAAVLFLTPRRRVRGHAVVSTGVLDTALLHPREVFRAAIVANSAAILVMHNHPSGDFTPSEADVSVTRSLIRAGGLLKIPIADHLVMGRPAIGSDRDYASLKELGYFYDS